MGKLGKETKNLLLAITVICLISFLLAAGLSFLLAKDFQHEMLLHDYGVSGYQLNHEDKLQISAFTAHPNESDIERGKEALALLDTVKQHLCSYCPLFGNIAIRRCCIYSCCCCFCSVWYIWFCCFICDASIELLMMQEVRFENFWMAIPCPELNVLKPVIGIAFSMMSMKWRLILSAHAESQKQTKEFLQDIISDVSHQIKTPLSALKMYHEIISSHKGEAETVANFSEKSQREIKRMENVIYTLLKLARLDAGIIQMEKAEENVSALMQDVLERFEHGQNRITKRSPFRVRMIFLLIAMHYGCRRRLEISSKMLWNTHNRAVTFRCNGHNHPC